MLGSLARIGLHVNHLACLGLARIRVHLDATLWPDRSSVRLNDDDLAALGLHLVGVHYDGLGAGRWRKCSKGADGDEGGEAQQRYQASKSIHSGVPFPIENVCVNISYRLWSWPAWALDRVCLKKRG